MLSSQHVYKSVWLAVVEQLVLEKGLSANPHDEFNCSGSDKGVSDSGSHSIR